MTQSQMEVMVDCRFEMENEARYAEMAENIKNMVKNGHLILANEILSICYPDITLAERQHVFNLAK